MNRNTSSGNPAAKVGLAVVAAAGLAWYMTSGAEKKGEGDRRGTKGLSDDLAGKAEWKNKAATPSFSYAEGASSAREAFEGAKRKTGNTTPDPAARPATYSQEVPETMDNIRQTK